MRTLDGAVDGDMVLGEDLDIRGTVRGSVCVPGGRTLALSGTVLGDVTVEAGGRADLDGSVRGTVFNLGGCVEIRGAVGSVVPGGGTITYGSDAVVRNR